MPGHRDRLHSGRRSHHHPARPCPGARRRHQGAVRGRAGEGQGSPLQAVSRRRRQLEPGGAHHRPLRNRRAGHRHPLHRCLAGERQSPHAVRGGLLPPGTGQNHIKSWKTHLAADRTSCTKATANQFRLFLHAAAYWRMWGLRASMPKRSSWRKAQFDTLRLKLVKVAARIVEMKTMIKLHLPQSSPAQDFASRWPASRASSRDRRGAAPQTKPKPPQPANPARQSPPRRRRGGAAPENAENQENRTRFCEG